MREEILQFGEPARVGVLTLPPAGRAPRCGLLMLNAGMLPRAGPQRLHVELARAAAAEGIASLRFDHAGIGESPAAAGDGDVVAQVVKETCDAAAWLRRISGCGPIAAFGICSGAETALRWSARAPGELGAILVNGRFLEARSETVEAVAALEASVRSGRLRGLPARLADAHSWRNFLRGRTDLRAWWRLGTAALRARLAGAPHALPLALDPSAALDAGRRLLFVFGTVDPHAAAFRKHVWPRLAAAHARSGQARLAQIPRADHVFTLAAHREALIATVLAWLATVSTAGDQFPPASSARSLGGAARGG
jgi:alpha-beta hydrolase superfamily lysophospholipase